MLEEAVVNHDAHQHAHLQKSNESIQEERDKTRMNSTDMGYPHWGAAYLLHSINYAQLQERPVQLPLTVVEKASGVMCTKSSASSSNSLIFHQQWPSYLYSSAILCPSCHWTCRLHACAIPWRMLEVWQWTVCQ